MFFSFLKLLLHKQYKFKSDVRKSRERYMTYFYFSTSRENTKNEGIQ